MGKKEGFFVFLVLTILVAFSYVGFFLEDEKIVSEKFLITGFASMDEGIIELEIKDYDYRREIHIHSPLNQTYNVSDEEKYDPYFIELDVSTNFEVSEWRYELYDMRHGGVKVSEVEGFVPNSTTIETVRWENRLVVYAREAGGYWFSGEVYFYVHRSNSAPVILNDFPETFYVCENDAIIYDYSVFDIDEDPVISQTVQGWPPFSSNRRTLNLNLSTHRFQTRTWPKTSITSVPYAFCSIVNSSLYCDATVEVSDGELSDSDSFQVIVMQINNVPKFNKFRTITKVYMQGDDSDFSEQFWVEDVEDGNSDSGNLDFNISFGLGVIPLFEIDESGWMNYVPKESDLGNNYVVTVCATDNELLNPHPNSSLCLPQTVSNNTICDSFVLAFTDENRAPILVNYSYKGEGVLNSSGLEKKEFWAEFYDPDGNNLSIDWYYERELVKSTDIVLRDDFNISFPCNDWGFKNLTVVASDGLANTSHSWEILLLPTACPISLPSGGGGAGGAGGGSGVCEAEWACGHWNVCQNVKRSRDSGVISPEEYVIYRGFCDEVGYDERFCGFQIRSCEETNNCSEGINSTKIPEEVQVCYFTENPSCFDGIKNCHSGSCEVLVDCGGPCDSCPTCSDGVQNQGEYGIDCGGPCPFSCEPEIPFGNLYIFALLIILLLILLIWIIYKVRKIIKEREELANRRKFFWRKK